MKKIVLFFLIPCFAASQDKAKLIIEPVDGPTPWTSLEMNDQSSQFQFAIVTDRTGGHRPGVFMDGVNKLNLLQPEFVMSVGDLIEGYTEDRKELNRQWDEFDAFVKQLQMPFFYIPGNHDITNQVMEDLWSARLGPNYYHFVYSNVLFLCLNSEDQRRGAGKGTISEEQFQYVKRVFTENPNVSWTLVFLHQPLWHQSDTKKWTDVEKLLSNRKHTVFTGHEHRYVKADRNNGKYFVLATTGGASRLRGPKLGEFDHVVWVTMTNQGPIIANLHLEGIWDENVVTQPVLDHLTIVANQSPFQIEPPFIDSPDFEGTDLDIKITNDKDVPLSVVLEEKFSFDLMAVLSEREFTVPPNSIKMTSLRLTSHNQSYNRPVGLKAFATYQTQDLADVAVPFRWNIKPLTKHWISKSQSKITIDGNDKDWKTYAHSWRSSDTEAEVKFNVTFDDQFVYLAAYVVDDSVVSLGKGSIWHQDHFYISLNADPLAKSSMSTGQQGREFHVRITPEDIDLKSVLSGELPEGSLLKSVIKQDGSFTELAVPVSYVKSGQGEEWETIRVNLAVSDVDQTENTLYWWQPDWAREENVIGSGMFFRNEN